MLAGNSSADEVKLIYSFPSSLRQDVEEAIKVLPANHNVLLEDGQIHIVDSLIHPAAHSIILDGEFLSIPKFPKLTDYIGKQIIDRIKASAQPPL